MANRFVDLIWGGVCAALLLPAPCVAQPRNAPRTGVDIWDDDPPPRPSPRPTPEPVSTLVAPLDEWVPTDEIPDLEENPSPTPSPSPTPAPTVAEADETPGGPSPWPVAPPPNYGSLANKGSISSSQIKRLKSVERLQRSVVAADRRRLRALFPSDPRGPAELTVCSADLNGYSVLTDFKRLFRGKGQKERRALERSLVEGVTAANCDVIAVQAVYGASFARATEALQKLAEELEKKLGVGWSVELEEIASQQAWSGFLIRKDGLKVEEVKSHEGVPVPDTQPQGAKPALASKQFPRAPVTLTIRVPGKQGAEARSVSIVSFDLRRALVAKSAEPEPILMRVAEALRSLVDEMVESRPADDEPLIVVAGQRGKGWSAPSALLLEGALRLDDFAEGQGCSLDANERTRCELTAAEGRSLFSVFPRPRPVKRKARHVTPDGAEGEHAESEGAAEEAPPSEVEPHADGAPSVEEGSEQAADAGAATPTPVPPNPRAIWLPPKSELTTDIYLPAADLSAAHLHAGKTGKYASGKVPFKNGLADGVLVWVTLNWK